MNFNYYDDYDRKVFQRCYLLVHGEPVAIEAQFSVNIFKKSQSEKTDLKFGIDIKNVQVEYTNDLVKNLAKTTLAFQLENIHNRFIDVVIRTDPNEYQKKLEFHTMIMYLTRGSYGRYTRKLGATPERVRARGTNETIDDADADWRTRKQRKKEKQFQQRLIELDKMLRSVNFKLTLKINEVKFDCLTDLDVVKYKEKRHV